MDCLTSSCSKLMGHNKQVRIVTSGLFNAFLVLPYLFLHMGFYITRQFAMTVACSSTNVLNCEETDNSV
jgi:hypothetical protein